MNIKNKKFLSLLLTLVLVMSSLIAGFAVFGEDMVELSAANFPDATFRSIVAEKYDADSDGYLSESERNVSVFSISGLVDPDIEAVESLEGIEFFPNITILRVGGVGLKTLDLRSLTKLTSLTCQGNELEELDVSYNMQLVTLNCSDNKITELDLGSNARLTTVYCYANEIESLDFRGCQGVSRLRCDQNELRYLDVSMLTKLTEFNCSKNHIPSLRLGTTGLDEVTDYMIGDQTINLTAKLEDDRIIIPFTNHGLTTSNYTVCTLDYYEGSGFEFDQFVANDVDEIADGITYTCSTGIAGSEDMSVIITVERDFYEVKFYQNEAMTILLSKDFVYSGQDASAPTVTPPECKAFSSWSEDITSIGSDMNVYALYDDAHSYAVTAFDGVDTATITCSVCGDSFTASFKEAISTEANADNYKDYFDVVPDGYINAKDFAKLCEMFG